MRVLLVEGDDRLGRALINVLARNGYQLHWIRSGAEALIEQADADLILLNLALPDQDGLAVLHRLRQVSAVPVLVLADRDDEPSVVAALHAGADAYLPKPVRPRELLATIEAVRRRFTYEQTRVIKVADVVIDLNARLVLVAGNPVSLTRKEFDVLAVLARAAGRAVSREQIMRQVWGRADQAVSHTLGVHVRALRAKLDRPELLLTIRGYGYRFGPPQACAIGQGHTASVSGA
jgi:DNA-binding response OmpR family regulator